MAFRVHNFAQKNGMVAGFNYSRKLAFESRQGTVEQGHAVGAGAPRDAFKSAFILAGERDRNILLRFRQDIHGEVRAGAEVLKERAAVIDADENEGRFDGNRREGTNGQTVR